MSSLARDMLTTVTPKSAVQSGPPARILERSYLLRANPKLSPLAIWLRSILEHRMIRTTRSERHLLLDNPPPGGMDHSLHRQLHLPGHPLPRQEHKAKIPPSLPTEHHDSVRLQIRLVKSQNPFSCGILRLCDETQRIKWSTQIHPRRPSPSPDLLGEAYSTGNPTLLCASRIHRSGRSKSLFPLRPRLTRW